MRIECPDCAARYEVPDDRLAAGRTVRCARCGHDWMPVPPVAVPRDPAPAAPVPEAANERPGRLRSPHPFMVPPRTPVSVPVPTVEALPEAEEPPARHRGLAIAWVLTLVVLVAGVWAVLRFAPAIADAWPPSLRIYNAFGMHVAGH